MARQKNVLVLFEDGIIREESILYGFELAKRLELPVALLMLVSNGSKVFDEKNVLKKTLLKPVAESPFETTRTVLYGDKATELLKYLAANATPAAIVWGSDSRMVGKNRVGKPNHWLNRLTSLLPCSIVSPIPKKKDENQIRSEG